MLVLSRQRDQVIMIGDDIEIHIVDIRGDKVRLGINCPRHIPVHRKEVYDAIKSSSSTPTGGPGKPHPAALLVLPWADAMGRFQVIRGSRCLRCGEGHLYSTNLRTNLVLCEICGPVLNSTECVIPDCHELRENGTLVPVCRKHAMLRG